MLLRRVIEHVKTQNWLAVGIDFFIVVVGVFIGIQVANWNETRKSNEELAVSLGNLAQEISNTADRRANQLDFQHETIRGLDFALDLLDGAELDEDEQALAFKALARGFPPPNPSRYETLYELRNSGRLKDVSPRDLRSALGELLSQDRLYQPFVEYWRQGVSAPPLSSAIVSYGRPNASAAGRPAGLVVTDVDLERARNDPDFGARILQIRALWVSVTTTNEASLRMDRLILGMLESEGFVPSGNWLEENIDRLLPGQQEGSPKS